MNERMTAIMEDQSAAYEYCVGPVGFKNGFKYAHDLLMKDVRGLVEALSEIAIEQEFYIKSKDYFSEVVRLNLTAKEALAEWNSKHGDNLTTKENENGTRDT